MIDFLTKVSGVFSKAAPPGTVVPMPWAAPAFEPGVPPAKTPINYPIDGQLLARLWNFPVNFNLKQTTDEIRRVGYNDLRFFANSLLAARKAIDIRAKEVCGFDWEVGDRRMDEPADPADIKRVRLFWERPDGENDFEQWLTRALEAVFVTDTLTLEPRWTLGKKFAGLDVIDGTTIKILSDATGRLPKPPWPRYRQILNGIPRSDFTADELIYNPYADSDEHPYGRSQLECAVIEVNLAMRMIMFVARWFTHGTLPAGFISGAEGWTVQQIKDYQTALNEVLAGNDKRRAGMIVLPPGAKFQEARPMEFTSFKNLDDLITKKILFAFEVQPNELGMTEDVNKSSGETQENVTYRKAIKPLTTFLRSMFNRINEKYLLAPKVGFFFRGFEPEDAFVNAQTDEIEIRTGVASIDDVRLKRGRQALGVKPFYVVNGIPTSLEKLLDPPKPADEPDDAAAKSKKQAEFERELVAFQKKAMQDLKSGRCRAFRADVLPALLVDEIERNLQAASTEEDVKAVFIKAARSASKRDVSGELERFVDRNEGEAARFFKSWLSDWARSVKKAFGEPPVVKAEVEVKLDLATVDRTLRNMKTTEGLGRTWAAKLKALFRDAGRRITAQIAAGARFDEGAPMASEFIDRQSGQLEKYLGEANYRDVEKILRRAHEEGMSTRATGELLDEFLDGRVKSSGESIARDELVGTANAAAEEAFRQAGFAKKQWSTSKDDKVRDSHALADGQTVKINEPFRVGASLLMFPGDKSADPSEWRQCRCTVVPVE